MPMNESCPKKCSGSRHVAQFGKILAELGDVLATIGHMLAELGQSLTYVDQNRPKSGQNRPIVRCSKCCREIARIDLFRRNWSERSQLWGRNGPNRPELGEVGPKLGSLSNCSAMVGCRVGRGHFLE